MIEPEPYVVDPDDPRAPSEEQWARMSPAERARVLAALPSEVPFEVAPPEGDLHRDAKERALDALGQFFRRIGRKVYLSSELATYYPGTPRIVPDVLAVLDVEPHPRSKWAVADEGRGLDWVLEVHVEGSRRKDHERNVALYAACGIPEYFLYDRSRQELRGFRLPSADARIYQPIVPQGGRWASAVLGLDLSVLEGRLRFFHGGAPLSEAEELIGRLETMVDELVEKRVDVEKALEDERRAREVAEGALEDERRAREEAERRLAELEAEIRRLRGGG
ncbi:Uma2 family endonuclease [Polyangium aurulentum]|uniref:Uma2 family endonuclease n=1 Tax=Polyangium aurulentum TaxID=2567896 RepID=UPI0010ADE665|nr:Uma2 family endonuclease [Polyangium aurulentum]UQA56418.1 Uma2 family endonuclease [Polyangium aurulentum]